MKSPATAPLVKLTGDPKKLVVCAHCAPHFAGKCAACKTAAPVVHWTQIRGDALLALDMCEACADAIGLSAQFTRGTQVEPPAQRALSAAPSADYIKMIEARREAERSYKFREEGACIAVPGIEGRWHSVRRLVDFMARQLYFTRAAARAAVLPGLRSAWEVAEFEQLICIGNGFAGDGGSHTFTKEADGHVDLYNRDSYGLFHETKVGFARLVVHVVFTLHYHAPALSAGAIPKLSLAEATDLAEALVGAEALVWQLQNSEAPVPWSLSNPSALQRQAWELKARLWREWPENKSFGILLPEKPSGPSYAEERLQRGVNGSSPKVAA